MVIIFSRAVNEISRNFHNFGGTLLAKCHNRFLVRGFFEYYVNFHKILLTPLIFDGDHLVPAESLTFLQRAAAIHLLLDGEGRHYGQGQSVAPPTH